MADQGVDERKLKELILYIAAHMERARHAGPGRIKLAKLLWLSDFEAFRRFGRSITGERYVADRLGPAPADEMMAVRDLEAQGDLLVEPGYQRQRLPRVQRPPDTAVFGRDELAVVNEVLEKYRTWTGNQLVELGHKHPGYRIAEPGSEVQYESAFLAERPPTDDDVVAARRIAHERGWIANGKWQRK